MIPKLGMHHLAMLAALAETGGVTAAAARLGVTQSAATHRLREAERRLGVTLARRRDGGWTLTPEGERLRALADRMLGDLVRLEQALEAERRGGVRLVRLGQATYSRWHWLPDFVSFLEERHPDLAVDLSGRAGARPFAALLEGSVDVAMVYGRPPGAERFDWLRLATDPLLAAMAPGHRLAGRDWIDSGHLGDERVYIYPLTGEPGFGWETVLGAPSTPYRRITEMPTPEAVIDLVRAGYGVGFFSRWALAPETRDGTLVAKPIGADGMALDWWAVTRAGEPEGSPARRLAAALAAWGGRRRRALSTLAFEAER